MNHLIDAQIALRAKQKQLALSSALKALENSPLPQAQCIIARLAWDGALKHDDAQLLAPWLQQQISQGNAYAYFIGALLDQSGKMYETNITRANERFQIAIDAGIADAMAGYANQFFKKNNTAGIIQETNASIKLLEKALELGSREAAYILGKFYKDQMHTLEDLKKAYYYLNIARLLLHENGKSHFLGIAQKNEANHFADIIKESEQTYYRVLTLNPEYPCI